MDPSLPAPEGIETVHLLMANVVMGLLIMPLVQWLKKLQIFAAIEPRYLVTGLTIICVFLLVQVFAPGLGWQEIVSSALAMVGASNLTHLGKKQIRKLSQGGI